MPKVQNTPARARLGTRRGTRRQTRKSRDCRHTNATTNAIRPTRHVRRDIRRDDRRDENVTSLKMIVLPIALAYVVALVCFSNDPIVCLKNRRDVARDIARHLAWVIALVCFTREIKNLNPIHKKICSVMQWQENRLGPYSRRLQVNPDWSRWHTIYSCLLTSTCIAGVLVQWLKLTARNVGDRGFEPCSGIQVSKKQNVSSLLTRKHSILWGASVTEK